MSDYRVWVIDRWVPLVAGGTNVASTVTFTSPGYIGGFFSWTISATNFSAADLYGGGYGATMLPAQIDSGPDIPWGADQNSPFVLSDVYITTAYTGRRLDTDNGSLYFGGFVAPTSWLDTIVGDSPAPAPAPPPPPPPSGVPNSLMMVGVGI